MAIVIKQGLDFKGIKKQLPRQYAAMIQEKIVGPGPLTMVFYPSTAVVHSREIHKALEKLGPANSDHKIFIGRCFTLESLEILGKLAVTVIELSSFGWTDPRHTEIRTLIGAKVKKPDLR